MTVNTTTAKIAYVGNGVTTAFAVPFVFFAANELEVIERTIATGAEVVRTLGTHFTVVGGDGATGTVTAISPPPATVTWTIRRLTARTQLIDYLTGDAFPAQTHERALDRLTALIQELDEVYSRALQVSRADPITLQTLPAAAQRALKYLAFDATGNPVAAAGAPGNVVVSAYMQTVLDDADAVAARATLGAAAAGSATTTAEGLIELATQAEANTGTDAVRALTPATLASISPASVPLDPAADQALILDASDASKLKRASLGSLAFQATYASADQTITLAGSLTLAHGLASTPRVVMAYLRCATAELGYSVNQETQCMAASSSALSAGAGSCILAIVPDATNINIRFPASALLVGHYTTGAATSITPASWRLKVYAYV